MIILVSDTAILINLELGGLLEAMFSCGITMVIPDCLYQRDFENHNGPYLRTLGLGVVTLTPKEMAIVQSIKSQRPELSLSDCFALVYALRLGHSLVSDNRDLCNEAIKNSGIVYGLLWILDRMEESGLVQKQLLLDGLTTIHQHPRCQLPKDEVIARFSRWKK